MHRLPLFRFPPSLAIGLFLSCLAAVGKGQEPPAVVTRPVEVWWGSYRNNEDLVGTNAAQWSTVQQQMDGYLLHGAYWNYSNNAIGSPSPETIGPQLASVLSNAGNKPVMLEHLLAGEYADVSSAFGYGYAGATNNAAGFGNGIANIKRLRGYGFKVQDVSTDYIMSTWDRAMRFHPDWAPGEFFTALTGDWDGYTGSIFSTNAGSVDRNTYGWFRQWVERLAQAFPDIRVSAVNSPVYFPWVDGTNVYRELGDGLNSFYAWLKIERRGTNYSAFYSGDGNGWQQLAATNLNLGVAPRAGFFVASLTNRAAEGRVDNVRAFPFFAQDIGDPGTPGEVTDFTTNTMSIVASGNDGLHPGNPARDAQFFAYREFSGDGTFTVRLDSLAGSNPARTNASGELPSAGLALRESLGANSRQVSLHGNAAKQLEFLARGTTGGALTNVVSPVAGQGTAPRWLRLVRAGNTVTALNSADGTAWITNASVTLTNFAPKLLVGLAADSQVTFETAAAQFSQADFNGQPFPGAGFSGYSATTIGAAGTASSSFSTNGEVLTLVAAGNGVAGTSDNLRYHHLAMTNDGTIVARLQYFADDATPSVALQPGAQLGLMLRSDTGVSAPQFSVAFTPEQGLVAQARAATNSPAATVAQSGAGTVSIEPSISGAYRPLVRYLTGNGYLEGLHGAFPGAYSNNFAGFTTDSPYAGYQKWGGSETQVDAMRHRRKIILYEQWLQSRGREHRFIANSTPSVVATNQDTRDAWDLAYKQQSLRSLQLHQLEGGRPDKVIFESWYDGPYTMVPETKDGSFANLARDGLLYIKGIGQSLDLYAKPGAATNTNAWVSSGTIQTNAAAAAAAPVLGQTATSMGSPVVFTVRLTNTGTVPALPVLQAYETGGSGWSNSYVLSSGSFTSNITAGITSSNGQTVTDSTLYSGTELIEANKAVDLTVTLTPTNALLKRKVLLRAFWNPQDPSAAVRDAIALEVVPPAELIQNGDFEAGTAGWTANGGSIALVSSNVHGGTNAIKSTRSQPYQGPAQDILGRLVPGQTYRLTAWVKADATANIKATVAYVGTNTNTVFSGITVLSNVSTVWQALQGYYKYAEPNGPASSLKLYFETTGSPANTGPIYVDDVSMVLASPEWKTATPGSYLWSTNSNWQSGNAPSSAAFNRIAFLPGASLSNGTVVAQQNLATPFILNSLALAGRSPANGTATIEIAGNALQLAESDGVAPSVELSASNSVRYLVSAPVQMAGDLTISGEGAGSFELAGNVSGTNALLKTGSALLALTASNSFSGPVSLVGGTLAFANAASLGRGTLTYAGGTLRSLDPSGPVLTNPVLLATNARLEGIFALTSALQLNADRTFDVAAGGSVTLAGPVSDDVATRKFAKAGAGTLVLAAGNSFRGYTTISNGVLRATDPQALPGTNGIDVLGGTNTATLDLSGGMNLAKSIQFVMHSQTNAPHSQLRNSSGTNIISAALKLNGGGARWDFSSLAGRLVVAGAVTNLNSGSDTWRTLYLSGPGAGSFEGPMFDGGAGGSSKLNLTILSGDWTLGGSNKSYAGATLVSNGTLRVNTAVASPIEVKQGGTFAGTGMTTTNLTLHNGATVLRPLQDWSDPGPAFTAARISGAPGLTNWTILLDAAGLSGFSEASNSIPVFSGALSNLPAGAVNLAVSGFAGGGVWTVSTNAASLSLLYTPAVQDAFASWAGSIVWEDRPSGPLDDPDADGVCNLAEYAFGGDPLGGPDEGRPVVSVSGGKLAVTFRRIADPDLIYEVLAADNLDSPAQVIWSSTGAQNADGMVTVEDSVTMAGRTKRFVRVRVTR